MIMASRVRYKDVTNGEEMKPWSYRVVREDLVRYAQASGDQNPIHQNEEFATSVGLPDVIAHGMHTMAKIAQYITDWCGDPGALRGFRTRFTAMVVVPKEDGGSVTVSGSVTEKLDQNRIHITVKAMNAEGAVAAAAEAVVELS